MANRMIARSDLAALLLIGALLGAAVVHDSLQRQSPSVMPSPPVVESPSPAIEPMVPAIEPMASAIELMASAPSPTAIPDFTARRYQHDVAARKADFVAFLMPYIEAENRRISAQRQRLLALAQRLDDGGDADTRDLDLVRVLADEYDLPTSLKIAAVVEELMHRVDQIPPSLVLAQAALESAWGTSRFAREANNLFGQWCWTEGCGVVPRQRPAGMSHEVRRFDSVDGSVRSYFRNINTHQAYAEVRDVRACQRDAGEVLAGTLLANGLSRYSAKKDDYVDTLHALIRHNGWQAMDGDEPPGSPCWLDTLPDVDVALADIDG